LSIHTINRKQTVKLKLLPIEKYKGGDNSDPIRYYSWPIIGDLYRRRVEMCLSECQGGEKILEVGFGSGQCFLNLKDRYTEIYGIDLSTDIHLVEATFIDQNVNLYLQNGNVLHLNFPDQSFDTVLLISILEHIQPHEQQQAFSEIRRVLKPGGQVVFGTPVERLFMVTMFRILGVNIREHHFSTHAEIAEAAESVFGQGKVKFLSVPLIGNIYEVGEFKRP
jgi:ubiquinone/menaquinone biosynthesis C-methylase UbiE